MTSTAAVRKIYRELLHVAKQQKGSAEATLSELRTKFRRPLAEKETVEVRLKEAQDRLSFLKISSVKGKPRGQSKSGRWIYKDGERLENVEGTIRDSKGRVISNWDGKNLDPESVKRHRQQLTRAGFVNNAHAKGLF